MKPQTEHATPRVLDTYGLTYAFTTLFLVPGLFMIDRWSIDAFTPGYLALIAVPFLLGPAVVFAIDSNDGPRTIAIRSAVLSPLVAFSAITLVFVTMMVIMPPLSIFIVRENFDALTLVFTAAVVLLAAPLGISLVARMREGYSPTGLVQIAALVVAIGVVAWVVVMTFDPGDTLGTFLRKDTVEHFIGAFTWYLPALGLAAGIWRGIDLV